MRGCIDKYPVKGSKPHWRYRIYLGKDASGKKRFEMRAGFKKESEAETALKQRLHDLENPAAAPAEAKPEPTLGEWLCTWLDTYAARKCQPKTLERYRQLAGYILKGPAIELSSAPLRSATEVLIEPMLWSLMDVKSQRRSHLSVKTIRHIAGLLTVALNKAFRLGMVPVNPMLKVELPTAPPHQARSLSLDEVGMLREVCRGDWTFAFVELALATASRRGELLALTWDDIDWTARQVTISKSLEQTKAGLRVKATRSGKMRIIALPQGAIEVLAFLRDQQAERGQLFRADYRPLNLVFCEPDGGYLDPALVSQTISRRLKKGRYRRREPSHSSAQPRLNTVVFWCSSPGCFRAAWTCRHQRHSADILPRTSVGRSSRC